jgi:hypothetical protein
MKASTPDRNSAGEPIFVKVTKPTGRRHYKLKHQVGHILYSQRREDLTALCYLICFCDHVEWLQPHELDAVDAPSTYDCGTDPLSLPKPS